MVCAHVPEACRRMGESKRDPDSGMERMKENGIVLASLGLIICASILIGWAIGVLAGMTP
jgi:hypothetical protein